jgi:Domain of unknown function (DU1801)
MDAMAANKTKPTDLSVASFVNALAEPVKRSDTKALIGLMKRATGEKAKMWGTSIIGFGTYHYAYESGREGDTVLVGFSPRKPAMVLYGVTGAQSAKALLAKLGKHTTGKGCLYIKKLADVDQEVLEELIVKAVAEKRAGLAKAG